MATPEPRKKRRKETILLVAFAAVIASVFLVQFYVSPENSNVSNICAGTVDVAPGQFTYESIQIASGKASAYITGSFSTAASNGTVRALIFSKTYFQLFQNTSLAFNSLYDSGLVSSGKFNVTLSTNSTEYYFVFDNSFDSAHSKIVNCTANLVYG